MILLTPKQYGFHLLEMLVVLCLISILAIVGYISYSHYALRAARIEAAIQLNQLSMLLEKNYLEHQTYDAISLTHSNHNKHYQVDIANIDKEYYELIAKPISTLAKEHACGALILDAHGSKRIIGSASLSDCW